jgi:hypothetical protein
MQTESAADELHRLIERVDAYFAGTIEGRTRMLNATQCDDIRAALARMRDIVEGSRQ